jgi:uncharacterized protein (TIGR02271 family)
MDRRDDSEMNHDMDSTVDDGETHATTGGAAAAGAVTGGVIGLAGGPLGAAIGAVGGAIVGAASERIMHSDDDRERAHAGVDHDHDHEHDHDHNPLDEESGSRERMQLREEELTARTTPVQTGQVTVGKEVVSEQRTIDVPVTREEVYVERTPVERRPADTPIDENSSRTIDVPVREEQVSVDKQSVVYEEVGVGKRNVTDTQQVSGTVRREEARIEHDGDVNVRRSEP